MWQGAFQTPVAEVKIFKFSINVLNLKKQHELNLPTPDKMWVCQPAAEVKNCVSIWSKYFHFFLSLNKL